MVTLGHRAKGAGKAHAQVEGRRELVEGAKVKQDHWQAPASPIHFQLPEIP
jgi:hypothetical protein